MSVGHAMLALCEGPQYELRRGEEFEDRADEVRPLNVRQVYTTVQRLERDGFAGSDESGVPSADLTRGCLRVPDA